MTDVKTDVSEIDFIFFDKGGTLSYQKPHEDGGVRAAKEIMDFLGQAIMSKMLVQLKTE